MSTEYKFKLIPTSKKYYNEYSSWGCYTFKTTEDLPECEPFIDIFDSNTEISYKMGTLTGKMQQLNIGTEYDVVASLVFNKKYNSWSYEVSSITTMLPKDLDSQKKFLESIITKNQTDALLSVYPNIVEDVMSGKTDFDLSQTKGIKAYTWNIIRQKIIENYVISDILILLQPIGVTFTMIKKLIANEPNPMLLKEKLLENPYILTTINGLGFRKVDELALKLCPELKESVKRVYAYLKYYLIEEIGENLGHTWIHKSILENVVRDNIPECMELFEEIIETEKSTKAFLYIDKKEDEEEERISLRYYKDIERNIYNLLRNINSIQKDWILNIDKGIHDSEIEQGFNLIEEQKKVVINAINENVVVISGKAGTGKTTISRTILNIYKQGGYDISTCALSAKAAQRIKEATGFNSQTIHRLLCAKGLNDFEYNKDNKLPYDVILIDEAGMINARLFYDLLVAIKQGTKVIICGDNRQLPPIGFGNIFSDLLELKETFNVNELTKVMRQAEKSGILTDANMIREGVNPIDKPELKLIHGELQDMYYMFRDNRDLLNEIAIKTYTKSIEEFGLDEVIIITPRKKDCLNSSREINIRIQNLLIDDDQPCIERGFVKYKLGAKVMQIVNNYEKNVFNGEIGYITEIMKFPTNEYFRVQYPDKTIEYVKDELDQIDLAYAMTVHKGQGSGYAVVIAIIDNTHYALLDSCLLYTAITRAKKRCLLLAEPHAFKVCIEKNNSISRQTWLKEMGSEYFN